MLCYRYVVACVVAFFDMYHRGEPERLPITDEVLNPFAEKQPGRYCNAQLVQHIPH